MNGWTIGLLAYFAATALLNVFLIGKTRKPVTPGVAAVALILTGFMCFVAVMAGR